MVGTYKMRIFCMAIRWKDTRIMLDLWSLCAVWGTSFGRTNLPQTNARVWKSSFISGVWVLASHSVNDAGTKHVLPQWQAFVTIKYETLKLNEFQSLSGENFFPRLLAPDQLIEWGPPRWMFPTFKCWCWMVMWRTSPSLTECTALAISADLTSGMVRNKSTSAVRISHTIPASEKSTHDGWMWQMRGAHIRGR